MLYLPIWVLIRANCVDRETKAFFVCTRFCCFLFMLFFLFLFLTSQISLKIRLHGFPLSRSLDEYCANRDTASGVGSYIIYLGNVIIIQHSIYLSVIYYILGKYLRISQDNNEKTEKRPVVSGTLYMLVYLLLICYYLHRIIVPNIPTMSSYIAHNPHVCI